MSNKKEEGLKATKEFKDEVVNDFEEIKRMKDVEMKAALDELMQKEEFKLASNMNKHLMQTVAEQEAEIVAINDNIIQTIKEVLPVELDNFKMVVTGSGLPIEKCVGVLSAVEELHASAINMKLKSSNYFLGKIDSAKFKAAEGEILSVEETVINSALETYAGKVSLFIVKIKTMEALEESIENLNTIIVNEKMLTDVVSSAKTYITATLTTDIEVAIQSAPIKERPILRQKYAITKAHQEAVLKSSDEAYTLIKATLKRDLEKIGRMKGYAVDTAHHSYKVDIILRVPSEIAGKMLEVTEVASQAEMMLAGFIQMLFASSNDENKVKLLDVLSIPSYSNMKIALVSKIFDTIEELSLENDSYAGYKELIDRVKEAEEIHGRQLKIAEEAVKAANIASADLVDKGLIKNPYELASEVTRVNGTVEEAVLVKEVEKEDCSPVSTGNEREPITE